MARKRKTILKKYLGRVYGAIPSFDFFTYLFRFSGAIAAGVILFIILAIGIKLFAEIQIEIITFSVPDILIIRTAEPTEKIDIFVPKIVAKTNSTPPPSRPRELFATFTELFSGIGWIDTETTTAWHDRKTESITLAPQYEQNRYATLAGIQVSNISKGGSSWLLSDKEGGLYILPIRSASPAPQLLPVQVGGTIEKIEYIPSIGKWIVLKSINGNGEVWSMEEENRKTERLLSFSPNGGIDISCIDNQCLLKNGNKLAKFFTTVSQPTPHPIPLPNEITNPESLGRVGSYWLVSAAEPGEIIQKKTYQFDGNTFLAIASLSVSSEYPGVMSFGGAPDDWLAVYGAYEGQGFRFSAIPPNKPSDNISSLFNIRVMEDAGFSAGIVSQENTHYIFAADRTRPKFLKIERGVAHDLTSALNLTQYRYTLIAEGPEQNSAAIAAVSDEGTKIIIFRNNGFDTSGTAHLFSKRLNTHPLTRKVVAAMITRIDGANMEYVDLSVSADGGETWHDAGEQEVIKFKDTPSESDFRWRATLRPSNDPHTSPSITEIQIRYYYEDFDF